MIAGQTSLEELLRAAESVKNMLVAHATGGRGDVAVYQRLRRVLVADPRTREKLPRFVHTCRTLDEFWGYIKQTSSTYEGRRQHLREEFHPLLTYLEDWHVAPGDGGTTAALEKFDSAYISGAWSKALERKATDPEGAITAARTLVESVCKHILEEAGQEYNDKADLRVLYSQTAKVLNLSPSQHTEEVFKQILGGCHAVVEGLGALRNRLSDAHGKGKAGVRPLPRHAELAVNLAGTMATYLAATWEAREKEEK